MDSPNHFTTRRDVPDKSGYDLTDTRNVRSYLEDHRGLKAFHIQPLSGGTANYVYRVVGEGVDAGRTWVLKHAAPQLASNSSFSLPQIRMDFEAKILANKLKDKNECHCTLTEVSDAAQASTERAHVHTVPLIFYEEDMKLLCIQDAGTQNLKDAYATLSNDQVQDIGTQIGSWLALLHEQTPSSSVTGDSGSNNKVGVTIARYTYTNMAESFRQTGHSAELGVLINDYFGEQITLDKDGVCHGDFWPGNVLLQGRAASQGPRVLTVVDWEMVRVGNGATDVGQFAAEAFLLDRFYGNKGLHAAFIRSYLQSGGVRFGDKDYLYRWMTRVAVHFAAHLAFWPSRNVHWANKEDTKPLVDLAVAILEDAISETPNAMNWAVFDGLPSLDTIAREMMAKRGDPMPDLDAIRKSQS